MIKSIIRILAFTSNWTAMVARQPSMLFWMIAGPFAVLLLFGLGAVVEEISPETIVVTREQSGEDSYAIRADDLSTYLRIIEVTDNLSHALEELRAGEVRLVLVLPENPSQSILNGQRARIQVYANEINPVRLAFLQIDMRGQISVVNNAAAARVIDMTKARLTKLELQLAETQPTLEAFGVPVDEIQSVREDIAKVQSIPSAVLVAPFDAEIENITPYAPSAISYFTPAALALVIQHLTVVVAGLSMVRARLLGTTRLWQTAPIRTEEIIAGNYLSYGSLVLGVSVILVLALTWALGMPILGPLPMLWLGIGLLILASMGLGFAISLVAKSEQTAAQMAMMVLLASIFLGGVAVPLEQIIPSVRLVSYLLPATYGGQILQDVMVRGNEGERVYFAALLLLALLGLVATIRLFRRELRPT